MFFSFMSNLSMFFQVKQQSPEKEILKIFLRDIGETFGCAGDDSDIGDDDDGGDFIVGVVNDGGGVVETFKDFFGGDEIDASGLVGCDEIGAARLD